MFAESAVLTSVMTRHIALGMYVQPFLPQFTPIDIAAVRADLRPVELKPQPAVENDPQRVLIESGIINARTGDGPMY